MSDEKLYSISEVCRQCGLVTYLLKFWEMTFPELQSPDGQQKTQYSAHDIALIWRIKKMLYVEHLTIDEAKRVLSSEKLFPVLDPGRADHGVTHFKTAQMLEEERREQEARRAAEAKKKARQALVTQALVDLKALKAELRR